MRRDSSRSPDTFPRPVTDDDGMDTSPEGGLSRKGIVAVAVVIVALVVFAVTVTLTSPADDPPPAPTLYDVQLETARLECQLAAHDLDQPVPEVCQ